MKITSFFRALLVPAAMANARFQTFQTSEEMQTAVAQWMDEATAAAVTSTYGDISVWNVSLVTEMKGLFQGYDSFNENITAWDTRNVEDASRPFFGAKSFNQDLTAWDTSKVTAMTSGFQGASAFTGDLSSWNTSQVISMGDMFRGASSFNSNVFSWDTRKLKDMSTMFWEATSFNADLSPWNVMKVRDFSSAFLDASSFGQQLCWPMKKRTNVLRMFCGTNGASIHQDCVCEHDLHWDEECVNPERVLEASCDPPSWQESSAAHRSVWVAGVAVVLLNQMLR